MVACETDQVRSPGSSRSSSSPSSETLQVLRDALECLESSASPMSRGGSPMASPKSRQHPILLKDNTNNLGGAGHSPTATKRWLSTPTRRHILSPSYSSESATPMVSPPRSRPPRPPRPQREPRLVSHGVPVPHQQDIPALNVRRATWVDSNGEFQQCAIAEYDEFERRFIKLLLLVGRTIQHSQAAVVSRWSPVLECAVECPLSLPRADGESVEKTVKKVLGDLNGGRISTSTINPDISPSGDAAMCGAFTDLAIVLVPSVDCLELFEGCHLVPIRELVHSELVIESHLASLLQGWMLSIDAHSEEEEIQEEEPEVSESEEQPSDVSELAQPTAPSQWDPLQQQFSVFTGTTPETLPIRSALGLGVAGCIAGGLLGFLFAKRR